MTGSVHLAAMPVNSVVEVLHAAEWSVLAARHTHLRDGVALLLTTIPASRVCLASAVRWVLVFGIICVAWLVAGIVRANVQPCFRGKTVGCC